MQRLLRRFEDTPSIIGLGFGRYAAVAVVLRQAVAEPRPVSDEESGCVHECWPSSAAEFWPTCRC